MKKRAFCFILLLALAMSMVFNVYGEGYIFLKEDGPFIFFEDFEDLDTGYDLVDVIGDYWIFHAPEALMKDDDQYKIIETDEDTRALKMQWIYGRLMKTAENVPIKAPFTLGGILKAVGDSAEKHGTHIWIRNPSEFHISDGGKTLQEYEADEEEKVGGTGMAVELYSNKIEIIIREFNQESASGLITKRAPINLPDGINMTKDFVPFEIEDKDGIISVYFANTLMSTIEYSEAKDGYYSRVLVKDKDGNLILESSDASLVTDDNDAAIAFSNRAGTITLEEVYLFSNYEEGKQIYLDKDTYSATGTINAGYLGTDEGDWVALVKKGTKVEGEEDVLQSAFLDKAGAISVKVKDLKIEAGEYELILFEKDSLDPIKSLEFTIEAAPVVEETEPPKEEEPKKTEAAKKEDKEKGSFNPLFVIIPLLLASVIIVVVVIVIVILKKKK